MQRVTESQFTFREINKVGRDLLFFKVGITHFMRHINFFNQPVWSRYNTISYYKLLIISQKIVCNTRALRVFTNSQKLKRLDCVSSFQTFPRTSKNHLPPLYRYILVLYPSNCQIAKLALSLHKTWLHCSGVKWRGFFFHLFNGRVALTLEMFGLWVVARP